MPDFPDFVVNQQSLICPKVVLTNTVNFGIGSAFMKGSQSAFSQGLLYKVCHLIINTSLFITKLSIYDRASRIVNSL